jgi:hypothetical protein
LLLKAVRNRELPYALLLLAVTIASWGVLVVYGLKAFSDLPYFDDWICIDDLHRFLSGQIGLSYFFLRHNTHPLLATRVVYYVDYKFAHLNLLYVRWLVAAIICTESAVIGWYIARTRSESSTNSGMNYFGAAIAVMCVTTLTQEEAFMVSSSPMIVGNLFVFASLITFQHWIRTGGRWSLIFSLLLALLASFNGAQSFVVWLALAVVALLGTDRSKDWRLIGLFSVCFAVFFVAAAADAGDRHLHNAIAFDFDPLQTFKSLLVLAGLSVSGQYHNAPVETLLGAAGAILAILSLVMLAEFFRAKPSERALVAPFIGYFIYGCISIVFVVIGRQGHHLDVARYCMVSAPIAIGLIGFFSVARGKSPAFSLALGALAALVFVGVGMADRDEFVYAQYRQKFIVGVYRYFENPQNLITLGFPADMFDRVVIFLRQEHLANFRSDSTGGVGPPDQP